MTSDEALNTKTHQAKMGCGTFYFRIVMDNAGNPKSLFISVGKPGHCQNALTQGLARAVTLGLEGGVPLSHFIKTFAGLHCHEAQIGEAHIRKLSCMDALAGVLEKYLPEDKESESKN